MTPRDPPLRTARCVLRAGDRFLLAIHNNQRPENARKWGLLGGRIERGESAEATARRELAEELGVELRAPLLHVGDYECRGLHRVFGTELDRATFQVDPAEIVELGWWLPERVARLQTRGWLHTGFEYTAIQDYLRLLASRVVTS